jgi:hypothetical protein
MRVVYRALGAAGASKPRIPIAPLAPPRATGVALLCAF